MAIVFDDAIELPQERRRLLVSSIFISATAALAFPSVLSLRRRGRLPLQVRDRVGSAAIERDNMVFDVAGAGTGRTPRRRAGMLPLKFVFDC